MPEERVRRSDLATLERGADRSRRDRRAAGGDRRNDDAGPPLLAAERLEEGRRALASLAEVEIVTDDDAGCTELLPEQALDESGRRRAGKAGVEAAHESAVEPELAKDRELRRLGGEAEQGLLRREELARMRLEGQDPPRGVAPPGPPPPQRRRRVPRPGPPHRDRDQRPMATVDAVEIADRQDRPAQGRRHGVAVADDGESARRLVGRRS